MGIDGVSGGVVEVGNFNMSGSAMTITAWANRGTSNDGRVISKGISSDENDIAWMMSSVDDGSYYPRMRIRTGGTTTTFPSTTLWPASDKRKSRNFEGAYRPR